MKPQPSVRPNGFDWFFAIFLSLLAAAFVFPTTCFGGVMLLLATTDLLHAGDIQLARGLVFVLAALCLGLTGYAAVWAARAYLRAVRKNAAEPSDKPKA